MGALRLELDSERSKQQFLSVIFEVTILRSVILFF